MFRFVYRKYYYKKIGYFVVKQSTNGMWKRCEESHIFRFAETVEPFSVLRKMNFILMSG